MKKIKTIILLLIMNVAFGEVPSIERQVWKETHQSSQVVIKNMIGDVRVRSTKIENEFEVVSVTQHNETKGVLMVETKIEDGVFYIEVTRKGHDKEPMELRINDQARIDLTVFIPKGNDISVETFDGLIEAKGLSDPLVATSKTGNIKMLKNKNSLNVFSYGGNVEANIYPNSTKNSQSFRTGTGDVFVNIGNKQEHKFEISTSGRITTDFSLKVVKEFSKEPNKHAKGKVNKSGPLIKMESIRGNVTFLSYQEKAQ